MATLRVKEICKEKSMTLADLAVKMQITASALSQNLKKPSFETLEKLARALDVEISELFSTSKTAKIVCPHCHKEIRIRIEDPTE